MQEQVLEQDKGEMMKVDGAGEETMEMKFDEDAEEKRRAWVGSQLGTDGKPMDVDHLMDAMRYGVMCSMDTGSKTVTRDEVGPDYYKNTKYEPRLVAKDWNLDPYLFNVMKYIKRCGLKVEPGLSQIESEIKDLNKAIDYIRFRIEELEEMKDEDDDDDY